MVRLSDDDAKAQIGQGFHTGLRKALDSHAAIVAWRAINDLPQEDWDAVLEWVVWGLAQQRIYLTKEE